MSKKRVYIVLSHTRRLNKGAWEVVEDVEFVSNVRPRHYATATVVADYRNRRILAKNKFEIANYAKFEEYVRSKYRKQMDELDLRYGHTVVAETPAATDALIVDNFGVSRLKTVFDK